MKKLILAWRTLIPLIIFIIIMIFLWCGLALDPRKIPSVLLDKPMPNFSLPSVLHPNQLLTQKEFIGHVSLLNVWATWCISCQAEHAVLMHIAQTGQVKLYGLNYKDSQVSARAWLQQQGDPYVASVADIEGQLAIDLGVYGTPETFIIDQQGVVRYKYVGPISPEVWQNELLPEIEKIKGNA